MSISTFRNLFAWLCLALFVPLNAFADVEINEQNFPDKYFRNYLLTQDYAEDGVITDEEIAGITSINVGSKYISSLEGIQYFTALTMLQCYNNQLTALDVSGCTALTRLSCYGNQLTALDVSNNAALKTLWCYNNQISGEKMDKFIKSLPNSNGVIRMYDNTSETEDNVCTESQVAAIKAKEWMPYYFIYGVEWLRYEGSDDPDGIIATEVDNGSEIDTNAPAYDLNGHRVEDWQSKEGIYIIGGKKVVVK